jgi:hypothetical protein
VLEVYNEWRPFVGVNAIGFVRDEKMFLWVYAFDPHFKGDEPTTQVFVFLAEGMGVS